MLHGRDCSLALAISVLSEHVVEVEKQDQGVASMPSNRMKTSSLADKSASQDGAI